MQTFEIQPVLPAPDVVCLVKLSDAGKDGAGEGAERVEEEAAEEGEGGEGGGCEEEDAEEGEGDGGVGEQVEVEGAGEGEEGVGGEDGAEFYFRGARGPLLEEEAGEDGYLVDVEGVGRECSRDGHGWGLRRGKGWGGGVIHIYIYMILV